MVFTDDSNNNNVVVVAICLIINVEAILIVLVLEDPRGPDLNYLSLSWPLGHNMLENFLIPTPNTETDPALLQNHFRGQTCKL